MVAAVHREQLVVAAVHTLARLHHLSHPARLELPRAPVVVSELDDDRVAPRGAYARPLARIEAHLRAARVPGGARRPLAVEAVQAAVVLLPRSQVVGRALLRDGAAAVRAGLAGRHRLAFS